MTSKMPQRAIGLAGLSVCLTVIFASIPAMAESVSTVPVLPANNSKGVEFIQPKNSGTAVSPAEQKSGVQLRTAPVMVNPTDPQAQALQKLNSRYNCGIAISTTPIARPEFSKQVSACLTAIEVKMAQESGIISNSEDLELLKELTAADRDEIDNLTNDVAFTNDRVTESTFSTTTKLVGEIIFGLNTFGGAPAPNSSNTTLTNRVRLNFDTSFTGKDRLRTRLQARNTVPFNSSVTGTNTTRLGFDGSEENASFVSLLQYKTPFDGKGTLILETVGSEYNENMYTFNPLLAGAGTGSISRFGRFNPVYRQSGDGAAATLEYKLTKELTGSIGYAVPGTTSSNPNTGSGLFGGNNSVIGQLRYQAAPGVDLGLAYARSYHSGGSGVTGTTGTALANRPFGNVPTSANHYNFLASAKLSPGFVLSGWAGLTNATRETAAGGSADIFNFAVSAAFPDFGAKGNNLAFILGAPPKVTASTGTVDTANPLHLEAVYKIKVSDNVDVTPGLLVITNPDTTTKDTEYVGTIRTTLRF